MRCASSAIIRTAGEIIDTAVLGSIEFAITVLKTPLIVILGHDSCGAVRAALDPVAIVRGRATSGGPQPAEMKRMLDEATARLDRQESWVVERQDHIDAALGRLDADFQSLLTQ